MKQQVDKVLSYILIGLMALMVVNVTWQVIARFLGVTGNFSSFTEELARFFLVWLGLLGSAYAAGQKMHLAIDLLPTKLEGTSRRNLNMLIHTVVFVFALTVMTIGGFMLAFLTLELGQTSPVMKIPLGYVYMALPLSGVLTVYYSLVNILEARSETA